MKNFIDEIPACAGMTDKNVQNYYLPRIILLITNKVPRHSCAGRNLDSEQAGILIWWWRWNILAGRFPLAREWRTRTYRIITCLESS